MSLRVSVGDCRAGEVQPHFIVRCGRDVAFSLPSTRFGASTDGGLVVSDCCEARIERTGEEAWCSACDRPVRPAPDVLYYPLDPSKPFLFTGPLMLGELFDPLTTGLLHNLLVQLASNLYSSSNYFMIFSLQARLSYLSQIAEYYSVVALDDPVLMPSEEDLSEWHIVAESASAR